jgi:hypothetical protein
LKGIVNQSVPLVKKTTEVFIIKENNWNSFGVKLFGKPGQVSFGAKGLLLVDGLISMPLTQITHNLAKELSQVVSFLRGTKEDKRNESVFTEQLIQQSHGSEIGSSRVVKELEHLEGEESIEWREEEARNETLL